MGRVSLRSNYTEMRGIPVIWGFDIVGFPLMTRIKDPKRLLAVFLILIVRELRSPPNLELRQVVMPQKKKMSY